MIKQYMDFVPAGKAKVKVSPQPVAKSSYVVSASKAKTKVSSQSVARSNYATPASGTKVNVPSQPVTRPNYDKKVTASVRKVTRTSGAVWAGSTGGKEAKKPSVKVERNTLELPKTAFLNTDKIAKRPLSKNVYHKAIEVPKETPSAPVTIIDKPEKDSKVGIVVTIIVTIVLGAAAGTVAFLLLPK